MFVSSLIFCLFTTPKINCEINKPDDQILPSCTFMSFKQFSYEILLVVYEGNRKARVSKQHKGAVLFSTKASL